MNETSHHKGPGIYWKYVHKMMEHDKPNKLEPYIYQTKKKIINASGTYPERKMNHRLQPSILQGFMGISIWPWIVQTA